MAQRMGKHGKFVQVHSARIFVWCRDSPAPRPTVYSVYLHARPHSRMGQALTWQGISTLPGNRS
eukprot:353272-Chlamydomonas_euryale.AAC.3